jgi:hypothetical protein
MAARGTRTLRGALAGAIAAAAWAAQQPLDKRAFGSDYDDVELLGRLVARRRPAWLGAGVALHLGNGAIFGAVYANLSPLLPLPPWARGLAAGMAEHVGLWPLGRLVDRFHPARDELPRLTGNRAALAQATWRHALFGVVLGELEHRLNAQPEIDFPDYSAASTNGHGSLEHAASAA